MKIGACQFSITSDIKQNMETIRNAIIRASSENIKLLVFPECALTGYPPYSLENPSKVDFGYLSSAYDELQSLSNKYDINIVVGTITRDGSKFYNSAVAFLPNRETAVYHKRALWGWDRENFCAGNNSGVFEIDGLKIGIRICFEVRFPEFFRELYIENTDLNIILFYDVCENDDIDRYEMIKSHIRTRAVENICHTLTVNTIHPFQTAPTALFDKSGRILAELKRNVSDLLIYDLKELPLDFGEQGRKEISDLLVKNCNINSNKYL